VERLRPARANGIEARPGAARRVVSAR
jgi:hypothetical protein